MDHCLCCLLFLFVRLISEDERQQLGSIAQQTTLLVLSNALHNVTPEDHDDFLERLRALDARKHNRSLSSSADFQKLKSHLNRLLLKLVAENKLSEEDRISVALAFLSSARANLLAQFEDLVCQRCTDLLLCDWLLSTIPQLDLARVYLPTASSGEKHSNDHIHVHSHGHRNHPHKPSGRSGSLSVGQGGAVDGVQLSVSVPFVQPASCLVVCTPHSLASSEVLRPASPDIAAAKYKNSSLSPDEPPSPLSLSPIQHPSELSSNFTNPSDLSAPRSGASQTSRPPISTLDSTRYQSAESMVNSLVSPRQELVKFRNAFLLCYRSVLSPAELLSRLLSLYVCPPACFADDVKSQESCRIRAGSVLVTWVREYYVPDFSASMNEKLSDFLAAQLGDPPALRLLRKTLVDTHCRLQCLPPFGDGCPPSSSSSTTSLLHSRPQSSMRSRVSSPNLVQLLAQQAEGSSTPCSPSQSVTTSSLSACPSPDFAAISTSTSPAIDSATSPGCLSMPSPRPATRHTAVTSARDIYDLTTAAVARVSIEPLSLEQPHVSLLQFKPEDIAKALTSLEFPYFRNVHRLELVDHRWKKRPHEAVNALFFIEEFNRLSAWVANEILFPDRLESRAHMLRHFAQVATCCCSLNNFHAALSVVAALKMHPVYRLKELHFVLDDEDRLALEPVEGLASTSDNYATYRAALLRGINENVPCIPHMAIMFRDLFLLQEVTPIERRHGVHDTTRFTLIAELIQQIIVLQSRPYAAKDLDIKRADSLLPLLRSRIQAAPSEDQLLARSLSLGPKMTWAQHRSARAFSVLTEEGLI